MILRIRSGKFTLKSCVNELKLPESRVREALKHMSDGKMVAAIVQLLHENLNYSGICRWTHLSQGEELHYESPT